MKNGRCRMHGGLSTGPRTPEGLERSRKARWKHGQRSAKVRAARRERAAALAWTRRFLNLLPNVDRLFQLLDEIAGQIDGSEPAQLKGKCVTALKLWREYQDVLNTMRQDRRRRALRHDQTATLDAAVLVMLEAGASGAGPDEIQAKLAAALSCNGTVT
jgi:hypothetical protein